MSSPASPHTAPLAMVPAWVGSLSLDLRMIRHKNSTKIFHDHVPLHAQPSKVVLFPNPNRFYARKSIAVSQLWVESLRVTCCCIRRASWKIMNSTLHSFLGPLITDAALAPDVGSSITLPMEDINRWRAAPRPALCWAREEAEINESEGHKKEF